MRAVLTYHSIDRSGSVISISPETFDSHVAWLRQSRVPVVGLEELLELPEEADGIAITFDDGLASVAREAAPRLADLGFRATLFVVTDHVGGTNNWGADGDPGIPRQPTLGWDALARLRESGWTIGSHTKSHPRLTHCSPGQVVDEMEGAAEAITTHLGAPPTEFAYPYGDVNAHVAVDASVRYRIAVTTTHLPVEREPQRHLLPRLDSWYFQDPAPFRDWGTPRFRRRVLWRHRLRLLRRMVL